MADLVIGSGPAGVAAASALLNKGRQVVMIDVGQLLEPERDAIRSQLSNIDPQSWNTQAVESYCQPQQNAEPGVLMRYGSQFLSQSADSIVVNKPDWFGLRPSNAKGGLSNGWGAAVLPYRQEDLSDWPITANDLSPHYKAVLDFMPMAARTDSLQNLFPDCDVSDGRALPSGSQSSEILKRFDRKSDQLNKLGVYAGSARQAVSTDCRMCGLCLYGCPYKYIYSAAHTVERLVKQTGFEYQSGFLAEQIEHTAKGVLVHCRQVSNGEPRTFSGDRLFVASGLLPTARLMLNSFGNNDDEVVLNDSQHFFLPMLDLQSSLKDPAKSPYHTLTQFFVEILDKNVSPFTVHAQLYGYNDFYAPEMATRYGTSLPFSKPLFDLICKRLIVAQTFLHSEHSPKIALKLENSASSPALSVRLIENPETNKVFKLAKNKMAQAMRKVGLIAITPAARLDPPGSSFHCGGTFPMAKKPIGLETDILGRPNGLPRIHIVDGSVLPTIPATTITFSIMANAHRIASLAPTQ